MRIKFIYLYFEAFDKKNTFNFRDQNETNPNKKCEMCCFSIALDFEYIEGHCIGF